MAVIKCKMCGGDLHLILGETVAECEYCGSKQTVPTAGSEKMLTLFARASRLRFSCEFDKAAGVYESIVAELPEEAEAYWGLVLCKYGIEYVDDLATGRKVPTCHRSSFESVMDDGNLEQACENADALARRVYREEAKTIEELRKGIIEVSGKEEPYDIFICYKETAENGERTLDSVLAQDIYTALTDKGYRVFFSRITLEDKLGQEYEPYIFAALHSARVMLAVGTDYEYYNAVWVKNEWSRFLALIASGEKKTMIPCYKGINAYDMPKEFAKLQAQDMSKLGFMQDLIRGIKKLTAVEKEPVVKETAVVKNEGNSNLSALLKRGYMALEDSEWDKADGFFEQVLNLDAENAEAYRGKTLAQQRCRSTEEFIAKRIAAMDSLQPETLSARQPDEATIDVAVNRFTVCGYLEESYIRKAFAYSFEYPSVVSACMAAREKEERYWSGDKHLSKAVKFSAGKDSELMKAKQRIRTSFDERIAAEQQKNTVAVKALLEAYPAHLEQAEERCRKEFAQQHTLHLNNAMAKEAEADKLLEEAKKTGQYVRYHSARAAYLEAKEQYQSLVSDTDTSKGIKRCTVRLGRIDIEVKELQVDDVKRLAEFKAAEANRRSAFNEAEAKRKTELKATAEKKRKRNVIIALSIITLLVLAIVTCVVIIPARHYSAAEKALAMGNFEEARTQFNAAEDYKDAAARIPECYYAQGEALLVQKDNTGADEAFKAAGSYKDAKGRIGEGYYLQAEALLLKGQYAKSVIHFIKAGTYSDAHERAMVLWNLIAVRHTIAAGTFHTVGLRVDGTVVAVGSDDNGQCNVSGWKDIVAIAVGNSHTVGLQADGTAVATGENYRGQCNVFGWRNLVAIEAGGQHTVGLREDGTAVAVGNNDYGQCNVSEWTELVAIAAGTFHTVGLRADGTAVAVGWNDYGECNVSDWTNFTAIATGWLNTVGLRSDGTVTAVGSNGSNQWKAWTNIVAIAEGDYHTVGLRADGTMVAAGKSNSGQCKVSGWTDIVAIDAGSFHTVGLRADGTAVATEYTGDFFDFGQCDVSSWTGIKLPVKK